MSDLSERRKVLLCITGSIAAYKSAELARLLISRGYELRVIMTQSAQQFITATTFQAITGQVAVTDFWDNSETTNIGHIHLADWADVMVIAPASADSIAKIAMGFADTPLLATALATKAPILIAPAMNVNMLEHEKTKQNIQILRDRGVQFVDPEEGELACGWNGSGRMADPWEIFHYIRRALSGQDYAQKRILITTGPTREPIDPVRFLSNRSSGKMGEAMAREAFRRGADVTLVHGPVHIKVPAAIRRIPITTALDMHAAVMQHCFEEKVSPDIVIMVAAVADYRPKDVSEQKIKKATKLTKIDLVPNPDILAELGKRRADERRPILVGFATETGELDDLLAEVRNKLLTKRTDLMVGNFAQEAFDLDTNRVWLVDRTGRQEEVSTTFKSRISNKILDAILRLQ